MTATDNPKELEGAKKPPFAHVPTTALRQQAAAHQIGAVKYGHLNHRAEGIDTATYYNAAMRHLLAWREAAERAFDAGADVAALSDEQRLEFGFDEIDAKTGIRASHMGYLMANAGIVEDAMCHGKIVDTIGKPEVKAKTSGKPSNAVSVVDPSRLASLTEDDEGLADYVTAPPTHPFKVGDRVQRKDGEPFLTGQPRGPFVATVAVAPGIGTLSASEVLVAVTLGVVWHFRFAVGGLELAPEETP